MCNPYSGHEKGNAERKVYYTRNLCFIPAPLMESDPELVEWLHRKMVEDRNRPHYEKGRWIEELWQEEQPELLALPEQDLPIFSLDHAYVNKYGEVMVDGKAFVVHGLSVPNRVLVKKEWNRFVVFSSDGDVHLEAPRPYTNVKREIPWKEIFAEWETKPGLSDIPATGRTCRRRSERIWLAPAPGGGPFERTASAVGSAHALRNRPVARGESAMGLGSS
ncbi:hypothetical protein GsuE55_08550 [Geobacillus subterraneus]|uniref:Uncharacterized protein n=1 Tax=Geobacillus subterraneus TaxID=129338 RepID=A0A679FI70_9BACL|nr:hypothetical protein GsuE55_08550 [Geobacillus subterraneus]